MLNGMSLDNGKEVIYVPGWLRSETDHTDNMRSLEQLFPQSSIEIRRWDSDRLSFGACRDNADREGLALAEHLKQLSEERRRNTVLVGHSLGARVVLRAMAKLAGDGMSIHRGVVLAAAIPWNDPGKAAAASKEKLICVCCQRDFTLKYLYGAGGENGSQALGINGCGESAEGITTLFMPAFVPEVVVPDATAMNFAAMRRICVHLAKFYLEYLLNYRETPQKEIIIRQHRPNHPQSVIDGEIWWNILDQAEGWKLEEHVITGHCRILDPNSVRQAWGGRTEMEDSFGNIRRQLQERKQP